MSSTAFISPTATSHITLTASVLYLTFVRCFNFIICHFSLKDQTKGGTLVRHLEP